MGCPILVINEGLSDTPWRHLDVIAHTDRHFQYNSTSLSVKGYDGAFGYYTNTYGLVTPTQTNSWKTLLKYDHITNDPVDEVLLRRAAKYVLLDLQDAGVKPVTPSYPTSFVKGTTCGQGWNQLYANKDQFLEDFDSYIPIMEQLMDGNYQSLWRLAMKREKLPITQISEDKIRSFVVPDVIWLSVCQAFNEDLNKQFKKIGWMAYGYNKYGGGCNRMCDYLTEMEDATYIASDVSGWDRRLKQQLVHEVNQMRKVFINFTDYWTEARYDEMCKQEEFAHVVDLLGNIIIMIDNWVSGSFNTTTTNSLAHCIIKYFHFLRLNPNLTRKEIKSMYRARIYSDDAIEAYSDARYCAPHKMRETYQIFNMDLDITNSEKFKMSNTIQGLDFLGDVITRIPYNWVWTRDIKQYLDSLYLEERPLTYLERDGKYKSLLYEFMWSPHHDYLRLACESIMGKLYTHALTYQKTNNWVLC